MSDCCTKMILESNIWQNFRHVLNFQTMSSLMTTYPHKMCLAITTPTLAHLKVQTKHARPPIVKCHFIRTTAPTRWPWKSTRWPWKSIKERSFWVLEVKGWCRRWQSSRVFDIFAYWGRVVPYSRVDRQFIKQLVIVSNPNASDCLIFVIVSSWIASYDKEWPKSYVSTKWCIYRWRYRMMNKFPIIYIQETHSYPVPKIWA